jgi:tetratricopeptide (TPR) repeat protein
MIDPNNPIVRLCAQAIECEQEGKAEAAQQLFLAAWEQSDRPVERAIAAHYVAKYQISLDMVLFWNQTALDHAVSAGNDEARELYPSFYLNLGRAHEDTGSVTDAIRCYEQAQECLQGLPEDGYYRLIRNAAAGGLDRIARLADQSPSGKG